MQGLRSEWLVIGVDVEVATFHEVPEALDGLVDGEKFPAHG